MGHNMVFSITPTWHMRNSYAPGDLHKYQGKIASMIIPAKFAGAPAAYGLNNELGFTYCREGVPKDVVSEYPLLVKMGLSPEPGVTCADRGWAHSAGHLASGQQVWKNTKFMQTLHF